MFVQLQLVGHKENGRTKSLSQKFNGEFLLFSDEVKEAEKKFRNERDIQSQPTQVQQQSEYATQCRAFPPLIHRLLWAREACFFFVLIYPAI